MKMHRTTLVFSTMAVLFALTSFLREPILSAIASYGGPAYETSIDSFDSSTQSPIVLSECPDSKNQRVRMRLSFCPSSFSGYPNLLQTGDQNSGVRFELNGDDLGVIYPGPDALAGTVIASDLKLDQWYDLEVDFLPGQFLTATCEGSPTFSTSKLGATDTARFVVGGGFDATRPFRGKIRSFTLQTEACIGAIRAEFVLFGVNLLVLTTAGLALWQMSRCNVTEPVRPTRSPSARPSNAHDPLLSLRAFAFFLVLIGHLFMNFFISERFSARLPDDPLVWLLFPCPWAGVWVFFVLSGYLMGKGFYSGRYSGAPQSIARFIWNRLLRIAPVYWSAVILVSYMTCPAIFQPENWGQLGALLIFDYRSDQRFNPIGTLWSISTEMQFYALVPLLFWLLSAVIQQSNRRLAAVAAGVMMAGLGWRIAVRSQLGADGMWAYVYAPAISNLDLFVLGMLANPIISQLKSLPKLSGQLTLGRGFLILGAGYLASALFGAKAMQGLVHPHVLWTYGPTIATLATMSVIACFELRTRQAEPNRWLRPLLAVGSAVGLLTYPLYVWHEPVLFAVKRFAPETINVGEALKYGLMGSIATWVVAEFVYRYIESPADRFKKGVRREASQLQLLDPQNQIGGPTTAEPSPMNARAA